MNAERLPAIVVFDLPLHRAKCNRCRGAGSLCAEALKIAEAQSEAFVDAALASVTWKVRA